MAQHGLQGLALTPAAEKKLHTWVQELSSALPKKVALLKKKHCQMKILPALRNIIAAHTAGLEPGAWKTAEIVRDALSAAQVPSKPVAVKYAESHVTRIFALVQSLKLKRAPSEHEMSIIAKK
jgi:hypothetical protein